MAIKQINAAAWKTHTWTTICDYCSAKTKKLAVDAGEASEFAHKEGFSTVSVGIELPMKWICMSCKDKKTVGKGVS